MAEATHQHPVDAVACSNCFLLTDGRSSDDVITFKGWIPDEETCDPTGAAGGPIEPWVYGAEAEAAIVSAIRLRAAMLPYLRVQIAATAENGQPMTRPAKLYNLPLFSLQHVLERTLVGASVRSMSSRHGTLLLFFWGADVRFPPMMTSSRLDRCGTITGMMPSR